MACPCSGLGKLWRFRDLIYFFAWRDVKVRYKQTLFRGAWGLSIQPFALMIVFTFVFGTIVNVPTPLGVPKPIFFSRVPRSLDPVLNFIGIRIGKSRLERGSHAEDLLPPPRSPSLVCRIGLG